MESPRRFVIVTGAGASRGVGLTKDLPLMGEWAAILREACESEEPRLADALGLKRDISAEEFEETMGAIFGLQGSPYLVKRFLRLGGPQPGSVINEVEVWLSRIQERFTKTVESLRKTLYLEFGRSSIDEDKAGTLVKGFLDLADSSDDRFIFATTNYDPVIEIGLTANNLVADDGFEQRPYQTPVLKPEGLGGWRETGGTQIPVLHLHGAVGWYSSEGGSIGRQYPDLPYNPTLGIPAILPPDPRKDPLANAYVAGIWNAFANALSGATHLLVAGHSLHDAPLVEAINTSAKNARKAVTHHALHGEDPSDTWDADPNDTPDANQTPAISDAISIPADLSPTPSFEPVSLKRWLD